MEQSLKISQRYNISSFFLVWWLDVMSTDFCLCSSWFVWRKDSRIPSVEAPLMLYWDWYVCGFSTPYWSNHSRWPVACCSLLKTPESMFFFSLIFRKTYDDRYTKTWKNQSILIQILTQSHGIFQKSISNATSLKTSLQKVLPGTTTLRSVKVSMDPSGRIIYQVPTSEMLMNR